MAKVQLGKGGSFDLLGDGTWYDQFDILGLSNENAAKATYTDKNSNKVVMEGSQLDSSKPNNVTGTVEHVVITDSEGRMIFDIDGLSMDYETLHDVVLIKEEWGITEFLRNLLVGDDKVTGTNDAEEFFTEQDAGDDVIKGLGGDDFFRGGPGSNNLDGGSGNDELAYHTTWWPEPQKRGVVLDVVQGTAINPWGGKDVIANFESYRGSNQKDDYKGSGKDEQFATIGGNDKIDGRGGFDIVDYHRDVSYGGNGGITVNMSTGKVTDGYGDVDTLISIEGIVGTQFKDKFVGSSGKDAFQSLGGDDTIEGKAGADTFVFKPDFDKDVITDFNGGKGDKILFQEFEEIGKFADLKPLIKQSGDDVVIDFGGGDVLTLSDVDKADLDKSDFGFG